MYIGRSLYLQKNTLVSLISKRFFFLRREIFVFQDNQCPLGT